MLCVPNVVQDDDPAGPGQPHAVRFLAAELGVSMSEVVRRALVHY
jgi:hypothetical protein